MQNDLELMQKMLEKAGIEYLIERTADNRDPPFKTVLHLKTASIIFNYEKLMAIGPPFVKEWK